VGGIHDSLLNCNERNLSDAFNDACVWIAELKLELERAEKSISSGFVRTDTTKIKWKSKHTVPAVDAGDAWIKTGVTDG